MKGLMRDLSVDNAKRTDRVISKRDTLKNAREFFNGREMITTAFKNGAFPLPDQSSIYREDKKKSLFPQKILLQKVIMMNLTPHKISLIYKAKNRLHKDIISWEKGPKY